MQKITHNVRVEGYERLVTPAALHAELPVTPEALETVTRGRKEVQSALRGEDNRLLVILGPCSIHDPESALDYAKRLNVLRREFEDQLLIVMRVYFEKPRTTVGWKGFLYDPRRDQSYDMNYGLTKGREILHQINAMGLPCATEFLDPIVPQYTADLVAWAAIGARTTESQTHRQMASGLSMPVGFKNATDGNLQVALDALTSARHSHAFLGINEEGQSSIVRTAGNPNGHLVMRGGVGKPNFSKAHVAFAEALLEEITDIPRPIIVDCSHANSNKDFTKQPQVFRDVVEQKAQGKTSILGVMLESFLVEGKQGLAESLTYGQSITDGCISWEQTEAILREGYARLSAA